MTTTTMSRTEYRLRMALDRKAKLEAELREVQATINERTAAYMREQSLLARPTEERLRAVLPRVKGTV